MSETTATPSTPVVTKVGTGFAGAVLALLRDVERKAVSAPVERPSTPRAA